VIAFAVLFACLALFLLAGDYPTTYDEFYVARLLVFVALIAVFFGWHLSRNNRLYIFSPSLLCFLGIVIVHFQRYLDLVVGFDVPERDIFSSLAIPEAGAISVLGLGSFVLGSLIETKFRYRFDVRLIKTYSLRGVVVISYVTYVLFIATIDRDYLRGIYDGGKYWGRASTLIYALYTASASAILVILYNNMLLEGFSSRRVLEYIKRIGYAPTAIIGVNMLMSFYVGDRGPVIFFGLLYFAYYFIHCIRIGWAKSLTIITVGALIMTLLGLSRTGNPLHAQPFINRVASGSDALKEKVLESQSIMPFTVELAGSVRCVHAAVTYIPETIDFGRGRYALTSFVTLVPFVGHLFFRGSESYLSTARLYTDLLSNFNPDSSGYGTTVIADFYADYGELAVIMGMLLLGIFMGFCDRTLFRREPVPLAVLCVVLVYLSRSLYISRSSAYLPMKSAVFVFLIILLCQIIFARRQLKV
jgi:hypothetical protein